MYYLHSIIYIINLGFLQYRNVIYVDVESRRFNTFFYCTVLHGLWSFVKFVFTSLTGKNVSISLQAILFNVFQLSVQTEHNELSVLRVNLFKHCSSNMNFKSKYFDRYVYQHSPCALKRR